MSKTERTSRRLQLHRETLRRLDTTELGEVAGGGFLQVSRILKTPTTGVSDGPAPKSGAWTGDDTDAGCSL